MRLFERKWTGLMAIRFCNVKQAWIATKGQFQIEFKVGTKITKESIAYLPATIEDWIEHALTYKNVEHAEVIDHESILVRYKHAQITSKVHLGHGEWEAKTLEDAKIMAEEFVLE